MTDSQQDKVQKFHENRLKAQTDLITLQQKILDSITSRDRRVRVQRLVKETEDTMTKAFNKNEQLKTLASKTSDSETVQADLEKWFSEVTEQNDEVLRKAREYIDSCTRSDVNSNSSIGTLECTGKPYLLKGQHSAFNISDSTTIPLTVQNWQITSFVPDSTNKHSTDKQRNFRVPDSTKSSKKLACAL